MRQRIIVIATLILVAIFSLPVLWDAQTDQREGDTATNIVAASDAPTGATEAPKKKGNRFARLFKAPFKAIGKIFDGDDKRDSGGGKLARTGEADAAKFESVAVMRVSDDRDARMPKANGAGTARDHLEAGRAMLAAGRLNEAIAELSRAASLDPRMVEAHNLLAVAYDRKGLRERAKESYERALDAGPEDAQALNNLGYSLYLNGNYRAAVERLKRAARLAPDDRRILNNLALAQCRLGKYDDAYKNFARAGGAFNGRMNTAALAERMGRDEKAIEHYEAARRLYPTSTTVLHRLLDLYKRTGHDGEAETIRRALVANGATEAAMN